MANTLLPIITASAARAGRADRQLDLEERRTNVAEELGRARLGLAEKQLGFDVEKFVFEQKKLDEQKKDAARKDKEKQLVGMRKTLNDGLVKQFQELAAVIGNEAAAAQIAAQPATMKLIADFQERMNLTEAELGFKPTNILEHVLGFGALEPSTTQSGEAARRELTGQLGRQPTDAESLTAAGAAPATDPATVRLQERRRALLGEKTKAVQEGNVELAQLLDQEVGELTAQIEASGGSASFDPRDPTKLTAARTTKQQETRTQAVELLNSLGVLDQQLKAAEASGTKIAGAAGAFKGLVNVTLGQFAKGFRSEDRAKFERSVKLFRQSALRVVSDESRFSEQDRDFIFELFPSTGLLGSDEEAQVKITVAIGFFARRLGSALGELGIDSASIANITPENIREAFLNGALTEEEAQRSLVILFPK